MKLSMKRSRTAIGQHAAHLRQLDVAEHRPARGAVDLRRLVVGVGDRPQAGVGTAAPPATVQCQTSIRMTVTQASNSLDRSCSGCRVLFEDRAEQADVGPPEDLPDGADHVPRNEQRQRHDHEAGGDAPALARHRQRDHDAERHLDREDHGREEQSCARATPETGCPDRSRDRATPRTSRRRSRRNDSRRRCPAPSSSPPSSAGCTALNATSRNTGSTRNQAFWLTVLSISRPLDQKAVGVDVNVRRIEHQSRLVARNRNPRRHLGREFHVADAHACETDAAEIVDPLDIGRQQAGAGRRDVDEFRAHADLDPRARAAGAS